MNKIINRIKDFFKSLFSVIRDFSSNNSVTEDFNEGTSASDDVLNQFSEAYLNNTFGIENTSDDKAVDNVEKEDTKN